MGKWKIGRVVDRGSLENCCTERYRRFESYIFRALKPIQVREQGRPELLVESEITLNLPMLGGGGDLAILPPRLTAGQVVLVHLIEVRILGR